MNKAELVNTIKSERVRWDALVGLVGPQDLDKPGVVGDWSVKDIIAHIMAWEGFTVERIARLRRGEKEAGAPLGDTRIDSMNAGFYEKYKDHPATEVLAESRQSFDSFLEVLESFSDEELNNPALIGLSAEVVPWKMFAANSYEHYDDHVPELRAWLGRNRL
jgi:hypothetical protein